MIKDDNYFIVMGWMTTKLGLTGAEREVFAIIYGFSQTQGNEFTGSIQYLADFCGRTKRHIIDILAKLTDKGYIIKNEEMTNGIKLCTYHVADFICGEEISPVVKKMQEGGEKISPGVVKKIPNGGEKISPDNKYINKYINKNKYTREDEPFPTGKNGITDDDIREIFNTDNNDLIEIVSSFVEYRKKDKKEPVSIRGLKIIAKKLSPYNDETKIDAIETAMMSGWQGVFIHDDNTKKKKPTSATTPMLNGKPDYSRPDAEGLTWLKPGVYADDDGNRVSVRFENANGGRKATLTWEDGSVQAFTYNGETRPIWLGGPD